MYQAMLENDFWLPRESSSIITAKWLKLVRKKKVFCPTYTNVKKRPCTNKPTRDFVLAELKKACRKHK